MPEFELTRLVSYDDAAIIDEMRRVASLVVSGALTRKAFDKHAKVSSSTIVHRFGPWHVALQRAGLDHRYSGVLVSDRMQRQDAKKMSDAQLLDEMRQAAAALGVEALTMEGFTGAAAVNAKAVKKRFGSWKAALEAAGLKQSSLGRRYSDSEYFENLLTVWTHHGRQPAYSEMNHAPSTITAGAYEAKWGTWRKALVAFIDAASSAPPARKSSVPATELPISGPVEAPERIEGRRTISLSIRYRVLQRDHYRCAICGASPATRSACELHVDHIKPVAAGGETVEANLRTLCQECNVGKGSRWKPGDAV